MRKYFETRMIILFLALLVVGCSDKSFPIDDNGILITTRKECAMTSFTLIGADFVPVFTSTVTLVTPDAAPEAIGIDTVKLTVRGEVKYGTNLTRLKPQCGHSPDAQITPAMGAWTDFSDLSNPLRYTVISGDRTIRKVYTIYLTVQTKP